MQQQDKMNNYFHHGIISSCSGSNNLKNFIFETKYNLKKNNYITWTVPLNAEVNDLFIILIRMKKFLNQK